MTATAHRIAQNRAQTARGASAQTLCPLVLGLLVSALGVAVFWFLRGRPKLW